MLFLNSSLLQWFMCLLLLWPSIIDSFPSTSLTFNRYERDTSGAEFPTISGRLELVIQNDEKYLEFEICCPDGRCNGNPFTFCFPTSDEGVDSSSYGCLPKTCGYEIIFVDANNFKFNRQYLFTPDSSCFTGKLSKTETSVSYQKDGETKSKNLHACALTIGTENRLVLDVKSIPSGATVTAKNAEEYIEPTPPPTSTSPSTETPKEISSEAPQTKKKEESGMSDAVKYTIFGVGALLLILVIGGAGFAIYWFCCKSKKSSKPAPTVVTVAQNEKPIDTTPVPAKDKAAVPKPSKAKPAKEESKVEKTVDPTPSNLLSSVAGLPPPTASQEPTLAAKPEQKQPVTSPYRQPSIDPLQHFSQPKTPPRGLLPAATPTIVDLLGRAGQRGLRGRKFNDTFDKIRKPQYENIFDAMVRQKWISDDQAVNVKEKYRREISEDEIRLFSLPIGDMYPKLNAMMEEAAYYHKPHDEEPKCILIENQYHTYFVSFCAIVAHFAQYFKIRGDDKLTTYSIPLLLGIAMDRAQTEAVRRRALVEMTLKGIQLTKVFTEQQCLRLPFPMNVMCLSFQLDPYLLENEHRLHTFSSPNNSECTKSDASTKKTAGDGQSTVADEGNRRRRDASTKKTGGGNVAADKDHRGGGGKKGSSSSSKAGGTKTTVSKEVVAVEKKKKKKKNGKRKH